MLTLVLLLWGLFFGLKEGSVTDWSDVWVYMPLYAGIPLWALWTYARIRLIAKIWHEIWGE